MEETPHLVTHFMAVGAEKRLEDYHFLRNTYETISGQEVQLNRILRMLGEDEISLSWRVDLSPIGRARSRSLYDFDRWANAMVLKGSLAYERLRDLEQDTSKNARPVTIPSSSRRVQEMRERRQRLSEQRDYPSESTGGARSTSSSSRLQALAEYETALAESDAKRQQQAEQNRFNTSKYDEQGVSERKRENFRTTVADDDRSYIKPKRQEEESSNRSTRKISLPADQGENASDKTRKSSMEHKPKKSGDMELTSFTVRCQPVPSSGNEEDEHSPSVRLLCRWAPPSASPDIDYFTIEQKSGDNEWQPIGEQIDKTENQTQLDIALSNENDEENDANRPSYFRLKAHLPNGQTFTSKPTNGILINLFQEKNIIKPDVEILSSNSVQLTWNDTENDANENEGGESEEKSTIYDIEKKEEEQPEWEKVTEVPLSRRSARIDSLTDAKQCQFRLIPTSAESEEILALNTIDKDISSAKEDNADQEATSNTTDLVDFSENQDEPEEIPTPNTMNKVKSSEKEAKSDKSTTSKATDLVDSSENQDEPEEIPTPNTMNKVKSSEKEAKSDKSVTSKATDLVDSSGNQDEPEEIPKSNTMDKVKSSEKEAKSDAPDLVDSSENQDEEEEIPKSNTMKSNQKASSSATDLADSSENEVEPEETAEPEDEEEEETEVLTVNNVNQWLSSLHVVPTSSNTVDVDISEEGFQEFDSYKIEYTTVDRLNQWKQVSDITQDDPHLSIDNLKQGTDYKFRFTPVASDESDGTNSSQLSLVLDVRMPSARKGRFTQDEVETPVATPPQFSIQKVDPSTVLIEAVVPEDEPAAFEDVYDIYSKKDTQDIDEDEDWTKVGTIDKEHLSTTVENLEENTAYAFKIDNVTSPSADQENNTVQELKFDTTPVKPYDPSLFLEKIEQSLENVVNGVMQAAAGHQVLDEPVNKSLNEVIKEVFRDESLVPNEEYGFDTLALNNDLQVYRGPKQLMLKDLEGAETSDLSKHEGEIIIHNYRTSQKSVVVREDNGNTRVANIDGDIIIRNVVSDVTLKNEQTHHQLSMNIVGQAFLKGVQGTLIASKFKGIIVVKNVNKP